MKTSKLITIEELSETLNVPISTIYQHTSKGLIPFYKVGKVLRFNLSDVLHNYSSEEIGSTDTLNNLQEVGSLTTEHNTTKGHFKDPFE